MKSKIISLLIYAAVVALVAFALGYLSGCAAFRADIIEPNEIHIQASTFMKDVIVDPNGIISTVSPQSPKIVDMFLGGVAGVILALLWGI